MEMMKNFRKHYSDFRANLFGAAAEIARLEAEEKQLLEAPIRFDCWKKRQLEVIDAIAEKREKKLVDNWVRALQKTHRHNIMDFPVERYSGPVKDDAAPFFGTSGMSGINHSPLDFTVSAGLEAGDMLLIDREAIKDAFGRIIERLRTHWPKDSECGPAMDKRHVRLAEIKVQLVKLYGERDEMLEVLGEINQHVNAHGELKAADPGEGGVRST